MTNTGRTSPDGAGDPTEQPQHDAQEPEATGMDETPASEHDAAGGHAPNAEQAPGDGAVSDVTADSGAQEPPPALVDPERWLSPAAALEEDSWPIYLPAAPGSARGRQLALEQARRASRRRRRYTFYLRRSSRAREAAKSASVARAAWATAAIMLVLIAALLSTAVAAAASYYNAEVPLLRGLPRQILNKDSVRIYDDKGTLLYQINTDGSQHSISLAQVPIDVVNATTAIEDHDFWINQGIDFTSIVRALTADLQTHSIQQGGSTITQQLIKQQVLGSEVDFTRKLNEAILAVGMTESGPSGDGGYSKRQILEMYLNSIPYSPTAYGIEAAAQEYFGYKADPATGRTAAQQLDLAQASMLAGIPQNPNLNDPLLHPQHAHDRQKQVLDAMVQYGYITPAQESAALAESSKPNFFHPITSEQNLAPHFVYYVRSLLEQMITTGQLHNLARSGLNVYTTLDMDLQNHAQQAMKDHLYGNDQTGYCCDLIRNANVTNSAEILVEQKTGAIKVYLGSIDYYSTKIDGKFDVVSQGYRGPGSSFKPFVYATAFEKGWFPAYTLLDQPTAFYDAGSGTQYKPLDFDATHVAGRVTLRTAIDWSLNIPAVKVMQFAGIDAVKQQVERMGITTTEGTWGLSSVLGAIQVTPFEMAQAYSVFANYGQYIPLHAIDRITDSSGNVLYTYVPPRPVQVMDPRIAFLITSILSDNASRAGDFGACSPLYLAPYFGTTHPHYGPSETSARGTGECGSIFAHGGFSPNAWPTAAKTGTGQDFKDDWTVGYTMDYTAAVWVGNNNNTPMVDIDGVTGAAPIWYQSMLYAEASTGKAKTPFPVPAGVHKANYCSQGVCTTDWFLDGPPPPPNLGEANSPFPCVTLLPQGGWDNSSTCQVALETKPGQNIGAPKNNQYAGIP
ncbi:MAG TPA: transglycosylase domain-containing protein [Dehalococcoidia bacterium]|nr:transglycosylase domain-containing protein [Dehalococcoidia bacterium]